MSYQFEHSWQHERERLAAIEGELDSLLYRVPNSDRRGARSALSRGGRWCRIDRPVAE
jgi:hypothetical protein